MSCLTDTNGEVAVEFLTTSQPGDNFTIAAGLSDTYLNGLTLSADGINLKDTSNTQIPVTTRNPTVNECLATTIAACRADMLTTWRRLHIEVNSMGNVTENKVEGTFPATRKVSAGTVTLTVSVPTPLETNRFENGRVVIKTRDNMGTVIGTRSLRLTNSSLTTNANTANTITVINNTGAFNIATNQSFTLYDDDDFNNSDGAILDGDDGDDEDITNPDMSLVSYENDNPITNILAPAYIMTFHISASDGDIRDNSIFRANLAENTESSVRSLFVDYDLTDGNINDQFWTVYILGAYQSILSRDNDPFTEPDVKGRVDAITGDTSDGSDGEGSGALIFLEIHRAKEISAYNAFPERQMKTSVAHEIGHLFGCQHGELEIMGELEDGAALSQRFSAESINKMRKISHP